MLGFVTTVKILPKKNLRIIFIYTTIVANFDVDLHP